MKILFDNKFGPGRFEQVRKYQASSISGSKCYYIELLLLAGMHLVGQWLSVQELRRKLVGHFLKIG